MAAASTAKQVIRRAQLYVPGSSMRFLEKSRGIAAVDSIAYDLEDSVTPNKKPEGRQNVLEILNRDRASGIREQAVRINAVDSGYALDDLTTILKGKHLDCLVVPKVDAPKDLHFVTDVLRQMLPDRHDPQSEAYNPVKIVALVESARSVMDLNAICKASPYLSGLTFAAEDFAMDLSLTRTPSLHEFLYARSAIVTAARAHNLPSALDLVSTTFRGEEGKKQIREESENGKRFGFNGKQCIHPDQVATVQEVYSPSEKEAEWAVRVVVCDRKASEQGRGAWTLDGKMIDAPVSGKARAIVAKADLCGLDVEALMERFKDEEPQ
ncbi:Putative hpcH/HpaI aldolase/citrate lyase domain, citrate lyase beta subunit [Septoria linicola]|uniref:HpcH/HpaI aldolase/citrate lyase domain, citrate lyase beta subunit n=1 Tax=Septoria linicola TaxID=215465 RepID=A0A9Q9B1I5_9PEZI|nr:putative hpcH/HpaI aldolase/citrate lyase domain, citrate lyase beta subunit [Septoria linicola]USW54641.1 Putative hpcH/HpaI aldolase/citrate lyase domain, citrate lyase beta subunit [Septoria linicola]